MRQPSRRPNLGPVAAAAACSIALLLPARAPAIVFDVQPIDGPSADVVDVADAAMSEDGSGGIVYLKTGRRSHDHVFAAQFRGGRLAPASAGRRRPGVRLELAADRSRRRRPPRRHLGAGVRGRKRPDVLGHARSRARRVPGAGAGRLQRRRSDRDLSRPGDEPRRPGLPRLPGGHRHEPGQPAGLRRRRHQGRPLQRPALVGARHPGRPQHRHAGPPADRGQLAEGRDRRPGRRRGRLAGARRRIRRPGLGAAPVRRRASASRCRSAPRAGKARRCEAPPTPSRSTSPASARPRSPSASSRARRASSTRRGSSSTRRPTSSPRSRRSFGARALADGGARGGLGAPSIGVDPRGLYVTGFASGTATLLGSGDDAGGGRVERLDGGASAVAGEPLVDLAETGRRGRRLAGAARGGRRWSASASDAPTAWSSRPS